jgi:hypothetical protein
MVSYRESGAGSSFNPIHSPKKHGVIEKTPVTRRSLSVVLAIFSVALPVTESWSIAVSKKGNIILQNSGETVTMYGAEMYAEGLMS